VSTKKYPIFKQWLTTGSVAFGASCGCSLPFTQNLAQSALIGLAAIPGVAVSTSVRSRQRQQQVNRQLERGKLRLNELQHRGEILNKQLRLRDKDRQEIEIRVAQLQSLAASLNDRINTDSQHYQQLEQQLASLAYYCQEQQSLATKLDRKIQEKQARSLEVDTNFNSLKVELDRLQSAKLQAIGAIDRAKISLSNIQSEIERCTATKQELGVEILARNDELESSSEYLAERLQQRELNIAQLELSSRQAELDNLELKLQARIQEIDEIELGKTLQAFEPKPPTIDRNIDSIAFTGAWHDKFIDNPHLPVLQHIEKHGTITEAEASSKLGNARSVRQFANKLEEYTPDLPFSIRVESSPKGNRYLKEIQN
jgi:chromosome segregation ATPase